MPLPIMDDMKARLTTKEVGARLFMQERDVRHLLRAGRVPMSKCGTCNLWDANAVEELITKLGLEGRRP